MNFFLTILVAIMILEGNYITAKEKETLDNSNFVKFSEFGKCMVDCGAGINPKMNKKPNVTIVEFYEYLWQTKLDYLNEFNSTIKSCEMYNGPSSTSNTNPIDCEKVINAYASLYVCAIKHLLNTSFLL
ncbi:uncharacterized protein LOC129606434 [Condylostylus longicornis]|uniref:uncharacterized protein LOC129606434 n=1 Tax=Condylostylus longicornis TaxID=2530218 RepID=UPI00244E2FAB|nr:uncharacterized protein LOC129606434 [Condylostylus longicornis]